jgi:hypothetical protein
MGALLGIEEDPDQSVLPSCCFRRKTFSASTSRRQALVPEAIQSKLALQTVTRASADPG